MAIPPVSGISRLTIISASASIDGIALPTWQHLWFVVYLWVYTMMLAAVGAVLRGREPAARCSTGCSAASRLWIWPTAWLRARFGVWLFPGGRETHALFGDWVAHRIYLPAFLFGFALAGSRAGVGQRSRGCGRWARAWRSLSYAVGRRDRAAHGRSTSSRHTPFGLIFSRRARRAGLEHDRRADRDRRPLLEPRHAVARDADRGGVPLLHHPPDDHRRRSTGVLLPLGLPARRRIRRSWSPRP